MNWKHWRWSDDIILPLSLLILRLCWLLPWLALLQRQLLPSHQDDTLLPVWLIAGLLLVSMAAARWLSRFPLARARLLIAVFGLAALLLVCWWQFYRLQYPLWDGRWLRLWGEELLFWRVEPPPSYLVLPLTVYLWLRGVVEGSRLIERRHVVRAFAAGCLALVAFLLLALLLESALPAGTGNYLFLFFAAGMVGLVFSSINTVPQYESIEGELPLLNRYWLGTILTIISGLLVVGLLLSLLLSPELVNQMVDSLWSVLSTVLILLVQLISLILSPILYLLAYLFAGQSPPDASSSPRPTEPIIGEEINQLATLLPAAEALPAEWRWLGLLGVMLGIGLLFALLLRRLSAAPKDEIAETRELIFSSDLLQAQLAALWPDWLGRLRRRRSALLNPFLSLAGEAETRRLIRASYQSMLAAARGRDLARRPPQTPVEYQQQLAKALPAAKESLATITDSYLQARYDATPPTAETAEQTRQAWQRLQLLLTKSGSGSKDGV
jgi:hypothetical protein